MAEQEKFEAWHLNQFGIKPDRSTDTTHVDYLREHHQLMWRGWQAAIASREPMPLEKAEEIAHVTAWDYKHAQGGRPNFYIFDKNTLEQLIRKVERFHGIGE